MKSAVSLLTDQIEEIRREAYAAGYDAAMQAVLNFAKQPTAKAQTPTRAAKEPAKRPARTPAPASRAPAKRETASQAPRRGRRGENVPLIEAALRSLPNQTGRAGDIRKAIKEQHETELAYTSIRHALGQLQKDSKVMLADDGKTWSLAATD